MDQLPGPTFRSSSQCVLRVFEAMSCGAILLDTSKAVIAASPRAKAFLRDGLLVRGGCLRSADHATDGLLQSILNAMLAGAPPEAERDSLGIPRRETDCPLIARVVAVKPDEPIAAEGVALIVALLDPQDCPKPSPALLQQVFGFTRSEARIAEHLMCGETLEGIAKHARVSLGTVRTQVKSIFAKTHTNRQAELVGLLTRMALISNRDTQSAREGHPAGEPCFLA